MANFLYFIAGCAVALALLEVAVLVWLRVRDEWFVNQPGMRTEFDIDTETVPQLSARASTSMNWDGERGDDAPRKGEDVYRVLVAGGSAAECYFLDQQDSWPRVLQDELQPHAQSVLGHARVHVGNVARSLVPCEVIDRILSKSLQRYEQLDLIVLMVGASDVVAWLERGTPDELVPGELEIEKICHEHPVGPFGWKPKATATWRLIRRWRQRLMRPVQHKSKVGKRIAKNRAMRAAAKNYIDEVPDPTPLERFFEDGFRALIETCKGHAKHVLVVRQPWLNKEFTPEEEAQLWNFGKGRPYEGAIEEYYTHRVVSELMSRLDLMQARISEELGVWCQDLMPHLPRDFETYYDYLHTTPKGCADIARLVAEEIRQREGSPAGETPASAPPSPPSLGVAMMESVER